MNAADESSTAVELNAQELLGLSTASEIEKRLANAKPPSDAFSSAPTPARTGRQRPALLLAVGLGLVIAAATSVGAYYKGSSEPVPAPRVVTTWHPTPAPVVAPEEVVVPVEPPVKFVNPFDKTEVFEFPAGTTRKEAREAVSELLMQRALEREQLHQARRSKKH